MPRVNLGVTLAHRLLLSAAVGLIPPGSVEGAAPPWQTARVVDVIPLVFAWTYEIETAAEIVVATQHKKPCRITLDAPLRVAVEGDHVRLIDEAGREHKLKIDFRRPKADAAPTKNEGTGPSLPRGGEIVKGMSPADVESALGKAKKVGEERGAIAWTYDDVVVFFRENRLEALELKQQ